MLRPVPEVLRNSRLGTGYRLGSQRAFYVVIRPQCKAKFTWRQRDGGLFLGRWELIAVLLAGSISTALVNAMQLPNDFGLNHFRMTFPLSDLFAWQSFPFLHISTYCLQSTMAIGNDQVECS